MAITVPKPSPTHVVGQVGSVIKDMFLANRFLRQVLALVLFFGGWQFLSAINFDFFINFQLIPSPLEVLKATVDFVTSDPWVHFRSSIQRVLLGYAVASV